MFRRVDPSTLKVPAPEDTLPGRLDPIPVPAAHHVNGNPLIGPFPEGTDTLIVAMGCFWGAERFYWQHGGRVDDRRRLQRRHYPQPDLRRDLHGHRTGHTEAVLIVFDPEVVSASTTLFKVFWENHDPVQYMGQGNDVGTQYRSAIYTNSDEADGGRHQASRDAYQRQADRGRFRRDHHRDRLRRSDWYYAEEYHQQYLAKNAERLLQPRLLPDRLHPGAHRVTANRRTFRQLHERGNPFVLANTWDLGSAKVLEALGAEAIGTSSAAHAFTLGRPDMGHVDRDEALAHAASVVGAVSVPVSGDLENGYGHGGPEVAETIVRAGEAGLAGCSIEDTALPDDRPYTMADAVARIKAAVAAARSLPDDFVVVARADGVMNGHYDVAEAIARIQAFEEVGADCVYVPLPPSFDDLARICDSVEVPVNALVAGPFTAYSRADFARIGVARLSLGSALARATHRTLIDVARTVLSSDGDFGDLARSIAGSEVDALLTSVTSDG